MEMDHSTPQTSEPSLTKQSMPLAESNLSNSAQGLTDATLATSSEANVPHPTRSPDLSALLAPISASSAISPPTRRKRSSEQQRERLRRFARKVVNIDDPVFQATEMARAREGKMSPQEKGKYLDIAYHFDEDVPVMPAPIVIQVQNVFADGDRREKTVTVGPKERE